MDKPLSGLESECKWIDSHPEYYDSKQHQESVKKMIAFRYRCAKMLNELNKVLGG